MTLLPAMTKEACFVCQKSLNKKGPRVCSSCQQSCHTQCAKIIPDELGSKKLVCFKCMEHKVNDHDVDSPIAATAKTRSTKTKIKGASVRPSSTGSDKDKCSGKKSNTSSRTTAPINEVHASQSSRVASQTAPAESSIGSILTATQKARPINSKPGTPRTAHTIFTPSSRTTDKEKASKNQETTPRSNTNYTAPRTEPTTEGSPSLPPLRAIPKCRK